MAIWIQSLSWALIYALGQGLLVYAALWLALKTMPSMPANAKYHLSLSALAILLVWFVATWSQQYHLLALADARLSASGAQNITATYEQLQSMRLMPARGNYQSALAFIRPLSPWLATFYFAGLLLMLVRLSAGMQQLFSLKKSGASQPGAVLTGMLSTLKNKLHYTGPVQLLISAKAHAPMVIGFLKPVILMPAAAIAQLNTEQLETILLHELAHIKRNDYLANILQSVVETILFFNPFTWLISAITRREREHCCDDLVLAHTSEPLFYATALATLATNPAAHPALAVAATGQPNYLFNRIKRIMEMRKNPFSYSRMAAAILIITAITGSIAMMSPAFAQPKKNKADAATATQPKPVMQNETSPEAQEGGLLVKRLAEANLVDETKGFTVVKEQNKLIINGQEQPDAIAAKYMAGLKQGQLRIEVYPFMERIIKHPQSSILQIIAPVNFSSPCVDYKAKKPGC